MIAVAVVVVVLADGLKKGTVWSTVSLSGAGCEGENVKKKKFVLS